MMSTTISFASGMSTATNFTPASCNPVRKWALRESGPAWRSPASRRRPYRQRAPCAAPGDCGRACRISTSTCSSTKVQLPPLRNVSTACRCASRPRPLSLALGGDAKIGNELAVMAGHWWSSSLRLYNQGAPDAVLGHDGLLGMNAVTDQLGKIRRPSSLPRMPCSRRMIILCSALPSPASSGDRPRPEVASNFSSSVTLQTFRGDMSGQITLSLERCAGRQ